MSGEVTPRPEARSRYGNGPVYEVLGKRYTVMPSSSGYQERGVASWYGKKFHGNLTSNREPYDMYAMTAAHKTLPLPTYVRVRNLRNDKSIIVRVNDRGPFVHNRIIDLSYAAAMKLDMIKDGTSLVEVTAISFDQPAGDRPNAEPHVTFSARRLKSGVPQPEPLPSRTPGLCPGWRLRRSIKCRAPARRIVAGRYQERLHSRGTCSGPRALPGPNRTRSRCRRSTTCSLRSSRASGSPILT